MKKINYNAFLVLFSIVFLVVGMWGAPAHAVYQDIILFGKAFLHGKVNEFPAFKEKIEDICSNKLNYYYPLIDLNSLRENIMGTRIIQKEDTIIVKANGGFLVGNPQSSINSSDSIDNSLSSIEAIREIAEANGAGFLYCPAPSKALFFTLPPNVKNYNDTNYNTLKQALSLRKIPFMDVAQMLQECGLSNKDLYFYTDHHWKPLAGFLTAQAICNELHNLYGFEFDQKLLDLTKYQVTTYQNWFLGSYGKKTGRLFTWKGAEDIDLITPLFSAEFIEEIPAKDINRQGSFIETMLHMESMKKDYYHSNPYAVYSGGDYRLQVIRNILNPNGPKILVIRNSYACVVTPFLAIQVSELHVVDDREGDYPAGDRVNLKEYIEKLQPEYVVVLK